MSEFTDRVTRVESVILKSAAVCVVLTTCFLVIGLVW